MFPGSLRVPRHWGEAPAGGLRARPRRRSRGGSLPTPRVARTPASFGAGKEIENFCCSAVTCRRWERQVARPQLTQTDRALMAAFDPVLPTAVLENVVLRDAGNGSALAPRLRQSRPPACRRDYICTTASTDRIVDSCSGPLLRNRPPSDEQPPATRPDPPLVPCSAE
jgi:hypothetical protein